MQLNYLISKKAHIAGKELFHIQRDTPQLLNWEKYGLKINVQKETIPENAELTALALVGGQFVFPKNTQLVSAVYSISVSKPLLKPLRLEMQHCVHIQSSAHTKYLKFAVASVDQSNLPYEFVPVDGGKFVPEEWYGSVKHKKFFLICILYEYDYEEYYKTAKKENDDDTQHGEQNGTSSGQQNGTSGQQNGTTEEEESTEDELSETVKSFIYFLMNLQ